MKYEYYGSILEQVELAKGTKEKTRILKENLDSTLEKILKHLYDPQFVTGISKTSFFKSKEHGIGVLLGYDVEEFIDYLHQNNSGKDSTVQLCREIYLREESEQGKKLIYWLATKDINIGISRGTVEKLVEIPKFEIMLGIRPELDEIDWCRQFILTEKLDGVNLTCFKRRDSITFFTRQGKLVEGLNDLEQEYTDLPDGVYFGEAIYDGPSKDRKELYRLSTGEISQKKDYKQIIHNVFDYVTLEEWDNKQFISTYGKTFFKIEKELERVNNPHIKMIPFVYMGNSREKALRYLEEEKQKGGEGLVLRYVSSVYQQERSKDFVKLKPRITLDLRVIRLTPHSKHKNEIGAAVVLYKGNEVKVGTGFSKEERERFFKHPELIVNKIIEVEVLEESQNKSGSYSLRHPAFNRIRDDKEEPSYD
ncbi:MAG: hypothetical protein IJ122_05945 [Methanobrevibacter sp.]|nr:hypothetical protein [Methanobrevibacter sp.]